MESPLNLTDVLADRWPADNVSLAVITAEGILGSVGDLDRVYRLASVTKPLVATALLVAVEEGTLDLDAPATQHGTTLRQLLSHASGVSPDDPDAQLAAPITKRIYSNAGFALADAALQAASGMSAAEYLDEGVATPLGMTATELRGPAGFGAFSSVRDLVVWATEWLSPGRLLDPSTIAQATTIQFPELAGVLPGYGSQRPNPWGLGVEIRGEKSPHWTGPQHSPQTFGHFGQSGTFVWIDPVAGVGAIGLGDRDFGPWAVEAWSGLNADLLRIALG